MSVLTTADGHPLDAEVQVWLSNEPSFGVVTNFGVNFKVEWSDFGRGSTATVWSASSCCGEEFTYEVDEDDLVVGDALFCIYCQEPQNIRQEHVGSRTISETAAITEALLAQIGGAIDPLAANIVVAHLIDQVRDHGQAIAHAVMELGDGYPLRLP